MEMAISIGLIQYGLPDIFVNVFASCVVISAWAIWFVLPTQRRNRIFSRLGRWHYVLAITLGFFIVSYLAVAWVPRQITVDFAAGVFFELRYLLWGINIPGN